MLTAINVFVSLLSLSSAINDGTIVESDEFPFVVSLQWDEEHKCGGTLINANTILTAAHCYHKTWVNKSQPSRVTALLGSQDLQPNGSYPFERVGIRRIIFPPDLPDEYKTNESVSASLDDETPWDYMLLKMNRSVKQNDSIKYATLAGDNNGTHLTPQPGDSCVPVGWGRYQSAVNATDSMDNDFSRLLRKGKITLLPSSFCFSGKNPTFPSTVVCARQDFACGKALGFPCYGDSGSPFICHSCNGTIGYVAGFAVEKELECAEWDARKELFGILSVRKWIDENL